MPGSDNSDRADPDPASSDHPPDRAPSDRPQRDRLSSMLLRIVAVIVVAEAIVLTGWAGLAVFDAGAHEPGANESDLGVSGAGLGIAAILATLAIGQIVAMVAVLRNRGWGRAPLLMIYVLQLLIATNFADRPAIAAGIAAPAVVVVSGLIWTSQRQLASVGSSSADS